MSRHDYSQYSKPKKPVNAPRPYTPVVQTMPKPREIKMVEETVDTVALPKTVNGVVTDCKKLNVRVAPSIEADVICALNVMSEVEIIITESTDDWFKIRTAAGVKGYCMRRFVDAHL